MNVFGLLFYVKNLIRMKLETLLNKILYFTLVLLLASNINRNNRSRTDTHKSMHDSHRKHSPNKLKLLFAQILMENTENRTTKPLFSCWRAHFGSTCEIFVFLISKHFREKLCKNTAVGQCVYPECSVLVVVVDVLLCVFFFSPFSYFQIASVIFPWLVAFVLNSSLIRSLSKN